MRVPLVRRSDYADKHDQDKLERWRQDVVAETQSHAVLHAVFLVTEKDRHAHDVFRVFRGAYEGLSAPFHCLVIFGQHGSSVTSRALVQRFGVAASSLPALVLFEGHRDSQAAIVPLGPSEEEASANNGRALLDRLVQSCCSGEALQEMIPGLQHITITSVSGGCIEELVRATLDQVTPLVGDS